MMKISPRSNLTSAHPWIICCVVIYHLQKKYTHKTRSHWFEALPVNSLPCFFCFPPIRKNTIQSTFIVQKIWNNWNLEQTANRRSFSPPVSAHGAVPGFLPGNAPPTRFERNTDHLECTVVIHQSVQQDDNCSATPYIG